MCNSCLRIQEILAAPEHIHIRVLHFLIGLGIDKGRDLVQGIGHHFHQTVRSGVCGGGNGHHTDIAILNHEEADGMDLHTAACTAAEGIIALGKVTAAKVES